MKLQCVSKLPNRKLICDVVRQGNNVESNVFGSATRARPDLPNDTVTMTFLEAYQYVWTMSGVAEYLRYQAWLQAYSVVPDGTTCWISGSHNKSCISEMWGGWAQARHEYEARAKNSGGQSNHKEPVHLKSPPIVDRNADRLWRNELEWVIDLIVNRLDTHYDDKGRYLSASPIAEGEHTSAVTHTQQAKQRAVPKMQAKTTLPDYPALRYRDMDRTCNFRLRFSFDNADKQAKYEHLIRRCTAHGLERHGPVGELVPAWNIGVYIRPAKEARHSELMSLLADKLIERDGEGREEAITLPPVETKSDWLECLPCGEFLREDTPSKEEEAIATRQGGGDAMVAGLSAVKETVMSPIEEQTSQIKSYWQAPEHSAQAWAEEMPKVSGLLYDKSLRRVAAFGMHSRLLSSNEGAREKAREEAALKIGMMGIGDMEKNELELMGPPQPTKLQSEYNVTAPEAPAKSKRSTLDLLISYDDVLSEVSKHIEVDEYLNSIGGASTFVKSETSGLYLPPNVVDDDAPAWLDA